MLQARGFLSRAGSWPLMVLALVLPLLLTTVAAEAAAPIALVHSERTAAAAANYPTYEDEYKTAAKWLSNYFAYDVLSDQDVENGKLAGYKLAILPENAVMSSAHVQALKDFAAAGGKILAVFSTSLRDDQLKLTGLQLGDLLGVKWVQWSPDKAFQQIEFIESSPVLAGAPQTVPVSGGSTQLVEVLDNGKVLGVRASSDGTLAMTNPAVVVESAAGLYIGSPVFAQQLLTGLEMQQLLYAVIKNYAPEAVKAEFQPMSFADAQ